MDARQMAERMYTIQRITSKSRPDLKQIWCHLPYATQIRAANSLKFTVILYPGTGFIR